MSDFLPTPERQSQILALLEQTQRLSVAEICSRFSISEATARRDLEALAEVGKLRRVHGGAIRLGQTPPEAPILQRQAEQTAAKQSIGRAAAALVGAGETIILGSGSTTLAVARHLRQGQDLTVITNSLPILDTLSDCPGINIIALGGVFRPTELSFIGHIAEQSLAEVRADKVIMGVRAISLDHGLTNDYLPETMTDRAILKAGRQVIVVADHTKFGAVSSAFLAPLEAIQILVTDSAAQVDFLEALRARGIRVIVNPD